MNEQILVGREKIWDELDAEAKIARMRQEVKRAQRQIHELSEKLHRLEKHRHGQDGELLMPYLSRDGEIIGFEQKHAE